MKNFHLKNKEVEDLRTAHRAERNRHAAYKINAIILLGTGWTLKHVKKALLLDDETLRSYVDKYQLGGIKALLQTNYTGRQVGFDDKQLKILRLELDSHIYLTTGAIIEFVFDNFNVSYSISGMRDLLHREGYTYKKPKYSGPHKSDNLLRYKN